MDLKMMQKAVYQNKINKNFRKMILAAEDRNGPGTIEKNLPTI